MFPIKNRENSSAKFQHSAMLHYACRLLLTENKKKITQQLWDNALFLLFCGGELKDYLL